MSEERGGFEGYRGVLFFRTGDTLVVSVEPTVAASASQSLRALTPDSIHDTSLLREVIGVEPYRIVGPVFQGFVTTTTFRPPPSTHEVTMSDLSVVMSHLRSACAEDEWEASGLGGVTEPVVAVLDGMSVVAAGGLRSRQEGVVDPCVLTRPNYRSRGMAKDLVAHLSMTALGRGELVVYQTLMSNSAAVAIARGLGFEQYATGVAMRLA